ncbi:GspH/FimT family pseudopilin [Nocardioides panaciterrulae]|uniref:Type IV fimbrial biogenesis protein FimT n=1 Tax=Nocardioides panaciterrulae TaxID=661492 RepID=A0A7Y9JC50_9ACTN|nr:GspH/FimT family pseudopilin [Nocardioides panaciterrulae]NYD42876.1 type IV fimbrial biogenesis protein FimT [Nocardioides panaciterrulae]
MSPPVRDAGFTLIEVLVTIALMGAMMAIAVTGFSHYSGAHEQAGTARSLQSALRQAQQRAVTEGRAICVKFADGDWSVWRTTCDAATGLKLDGPTSTESTSVHLDPSHDSELIFTPRGTATWSSIGTDPVDDECGHVQAFKLWVTRDGSTKTYRLCVPALTGRVELNG